MPLLNTPDLIFTVKELNNQIKNYLEQNFSNIWVTGEISNFSCPSSGHMYFTLKDSGAQIRCAFFKQKQWGLKLKPFDGMQVLVRGKLSLYSERGDYQLILDQVNLQGEGALQQEFELLKKKLSAQGYFDESTKKPIPKHIKTLGIITSATGAALQDILSVIQRRWPFLSIIIYDAQVQGAEAPAQLIKALNYANQDKTCDCLLLTRGGGSLEDLWAFNNENLCLAIFQSSIPIISAVGHEIDFTLSDFVADLRAATPSAAAELLTPDRQEIMRQIHNNISICRNLILNKIFNYYQNHKNLYKKLLQSSLYALDKNKNHYQLLNFKLKHLDPAELIKKTQDSHQRLNTALYKIINTNLSNQKLKLENLIHKLELLGPINILKRGFSIAQTKTGHIITRAADVEINQEIDLHLSEGKITCTVLKQDFDSF